MGDTGAYGAYVHIPFCAVRCDYCAFAAWDERDCEAALDALQEAMAAADDPEVRDLVRRVMVAIFTELGPASEVAREHRRRLAAVLH